MRSGLPQGADNGIDIILDVVQVVISNATFFCQRTCVDEDQLSELEIADCVIEDQNAHQVQLKQVVFRNVEFKEVALNRCDMVDARFVNCDLSNADFSGAIIHKTEFENCKLIGANLNDCTFQNVVINNCNGKYGNYRFSRWKKTAIEDKEARKVKTSFYVSQEALDLLHEMSYVSRKNEGRKVSMGELLDMAIKDLAKKRKVSLSPAE